jgi:nucleotide-binding universal stress UspA family protein
MSTDETPSGPRVLIPIKILEGETLGESVVDLLATLPVVVLGYHVVPEQTAPGQARMGFGEQAQAKLDDIAAAFVEAGGEAETRLVFTHDGAQTRDRVADETRCDTILIPNPAPEITRVLVLLRKADDLTRVTGLVGRLIGDRSITVTLSYVSTSEDDAETGEAVVSDATARLRDAGVPAENIRTDPLASGGSLETIATAAADHDAVVMGESASSVRSFLFGEESKQVAARSLGPVVVVRRSRTSGNTDPSGTSDEV